MKIRLGLHKNLTSAYGFFLLTALAYFCGRIYTIFTHGETSKALSSVWIFLLLFGTGVRILTAIVLTMLKRRPRRIASDIYDSGVIAYTAGMSMRGIFEIFGSDKYLIRYYEIAGVGLIAIGFVLIAVCSQKLAEYSSENSVLEIFIAEKIVTRSGARIGAKELYSLHNKWAIENGYYPLSRRRFINGLKCHYTLLRCGIIDEFTVMEVAIRE